MPPARYLLILNRSDHVIPAVARLDRRQAAAYFMLGETKGTSAGGAAESGRSLRVPGTNPFFFNDDAWQGNRLLELLETIPDLQVYLLNTGQVGAASDGDERAKKVRIRDSSAIVAGIVSDTIEWERDPDFGYEVAGSVPGIEDPAILQPRRLYERQSRRSEYEAKVGQLQRERREYLASYPALDPRVAAGL